MYVAITQPYNSKFTPRRSNKSSPADALWNHMPHNTPLPKINIQYILDRGTLFYRVSLCEGSPYGKTCKHYVEYVSKHYKTLIYVLMWFTRNSLASM